MASYPADLAILIRDRLKRDKMVCPDIAVITDLLETVYFVSLKTEEAQHLRCWVAFIDPANPDADPPFRVRADRWSLVRFAKRLPFNAKSLAKLAPAADPWSTAIAVYHKNAQLFIWGLVDQTVHASTSLVRESPPRYAQPGLFYVVIDGTAELSVYREDSLIARLRQDTLIAREHDALWRGPVYKKLLPAIRKLRKVVVQTVGKEVYEESYFSPGGIEEEWIGTLSRVLIGIQRYRHGGALLISDSADDLRFKYPLQYQRLKDCLSRRAVHQVRASATMHRIHDKYIEYDKKQIPMRLYNDESIAKSEEEDCDAELRGCVRFISSLSRVDGLIHCDFDLSLTGFGAEILIGEDPKRVFQANAADPQKKDAIPIDPSHFGMRHRSMMRYCARYPRSVGFVVSQDGDIRAITSVGSNVYVWENVMVLHLFKEYIKRMDRRLKKKYGGNFGSTSS